MKASEFKAKCLAVLDDVHRTGEPVIVTKRGRAVARVVSAASGPDVYPQQTLVGTVRILGDIVSPALPADVWDAARRRRRR